MRIGGAQLKRKTAMMRMRMTMTMAAFGGQLLQLHLVEEEDKLSLFNQGKTYEALS